MKKVSILLVCFLFVSIAFADFNLGLKVGANYDYIRQNSFDHQAYIDQFADIGSINSYVGGIFAGFGVGFFSVHLETMMSMQGFDLQELVDGEDFFQVMKKTRIQTDYLNASLMARLHLNLEVIKPYIAAGINLGIPIDRAGMSGRSIDISNYDLSRMGLAVSVGVKVFDLVDADLRFVNGITDIFSGDISYTDNTFAQLVRLSLGLYIF